jgi:hypothetical protein
MNKDSERITEDEMIDYLNARNAQDNPWITKSILVLLN